MHREQYFPVRAAHRQQDGISQTAVKIRGGRMLQKNERGRYSGAYKAYRTQSAPCGTHDKEVLRRRKRSGRTHFYRHGGTYKSRFYFRYRQREQVRHIRKQMYRKSNPLITALLGLKEVKPPPF